MRTHTTLVLFPLFSKFALAALATTCYQLLDSEKVPQLAPVDWYPCGTVTATSGPLACCSNGDTCLGDNICKSHNGPSGKDSGYYMGGCTDSTWSFKPACTDHCNSDAYPDAVYNTTSDLWNCCGETNFNPDCSLQNSLNEAFSAPAPTALTGTIVAVQPSSAPSSSSASTSSAAAIPNPEPSTGLGTGASVGIGVGVAAVVLAAALGIVLLFWRRRQKRNQGSIELPAFSESSGGDFSSAHPDGGYQPVDGQHKAGFVGQILSPGGSYDKKGSPFTELASPVAPSEMANEQIYEMAGSDTRHEMRA